MVALLSSRTLFGLDSIRIVNSEVDSAAGDCEHPAGIDQ
jgi:hypothetical protein